MAYHPETHTMDVRLTDGTVERRRIAHVERFVAWAPATSLEGYRDQPRGGYEVFQPQPELRDGEEICWLIGSDVPTVVQARAPRR